MAAPLPPTAMAPTAAPIPLPMATLAASMPFVVFAWTVTEWVEIPTVWPSAVCNRSSAIRTAFHPYITALLLFSLPPRPLAGSLLIRLS